MMGTPNSPHTPIQCTMYKPRLHINHPTRQVKRYETSSNLFYNSCKVVCFRYFLSVLVLSRSLSVLESSSAMVNEDENCGLCSVDTFLIVVCKMLTVSLISPLLRNKVKRVRLNTLQSCTLREHNKQK